MRLEIKNHFCLTEGSEEKSIHYLTLGLPSTENSPLDYQPGDWLTVQAMNKDSLVNALLSKLQLSGDEKLELRREGSVSSRTALQHHLEITQLNPAILSKLQRQLQIGTWQDRNEMIEFAKGKDILDLLDLFPSLSTMGVDFLAFLSPLAPRYYSIASANLDNKNVSILYRQVNYHYNQRERFGVASNFLFDQGVEGEVEVEIKANPTFKLPEDPATPVIMIAAGTGIAPFIGFMQQREFDSKQGEALGRALMFYGETSAATHCLFCDEFKEWQEQGLVENFYAFSRDQEHKVYVQHKLSEQATLVQQLLDEGAHIYICGSQDKLAVSVKDTMLAIFQQQAGMSADAAETYWQTLRKEKRLQQDVY